MAGSIFYLISYSILVLGLFLVKRSEKNQSVVLSLSIVVMTSLCFQGVVGAFLYLTKLPASVITMGLADLLMGAILIFLLKKKGRQTFYFDFTDLVAAIVAVLVAGFVYFWKFKMGTEINFVSVDSAAHMRFARTIALEHTIPLNRFFAAINTAMPMEVFLPQTGVFECFKTFILWETGYFFLSGYMFYAIIREFIQTKGLKLAAIFSMLVYMLGYPLYSYLFGYSYFGVSIPVIAYVFYSAMLYINSEINDLISGVMLSMGLLGVFLCYSMFVPVVFVGVFVAITIGIICIGKLFTFKSIRKLVVVFVFPSIVGMLITFGDLANLSGSSGGNGGGSDAPSGIALDGGCYNDMYSNFLWLMPLAIYGAILTCKEVRMLYNRKKESLKKSKKSTSYVVSRSEAISVSLFASVIFLLLFMLLLFAGGMVGKVSVYYYVKNNNLLMLIIAALAFKGVAYIYTNHRSLVVSGYIVLALIMLMLGLNVDGWILSKNERFIRIGVNQMFDIYTFNRSFALMSDPINSDDQAIYKYAKDELFAKDKAAPSEVMVIGSDAYDIWFRVMTDQDDVVTIIDYNQFLNTDRSDVKYICIQKTNVYYTDVETFDNIGEILVDNSRGLVIKVNN